MTVASVGIVAGIGLVLAVGLAWRGAVNRRARSTRSRERQAALEARWRQGLTRGDDRPRAT